jgi:predicted small lipoprotein YifL
MRPFLTSLGICFLLGLGLQGCGVKGPLKPPTDPSAEVNAKSTELDSKDASEDSKDKKDEDEKNGS